MCSSEAVCASVSPANLDIALERGSFLHGSGDNSGPTSSIPDGRPIHSESCTLLWWGFCSCHTTFSHARTRTHARQFDYDVLVDRLAEGHYPDVSET